MKRVQDEYAKLGLIIFGAGAALIVLYRIIDLSLIHIYSLLLWEKIKGQLADRADVSEVSLRNGQLLDCRGCKYEDCLHFGERGGCFYGGIMVEQVYPCLLYTTRCV